MNAEQLHRIVSKWPREAWPEGVKWNPGEEWGTTQGFDNELGDPVNDAHAVMLFESAGLRWLLEHSEDITVFRSKAGYTAAIDTGSYGAHTLIQAISAAISGASE